MFYISISYIIYLLYYLLFIIYFNNRIIYFNNKEKIILIFNLHKIIKNAMNDNILYENSFVFLFYFVHMQCLIFFINVEK